MRAVSQDSGATKQRTRRGANRAAFRASADVALSLPRLLPAARRRYVQCDRGDALGQVAVHMLDEGLLSCEETGESVDVLVERGLSAWLNRMFGDLSWFSLACVIFDNPYSAIGYTQADLASFNSEEEVEAAISSASGLESSREQIALAFVSHQRNDAFVGDGVERLNRAAPGLGWACLDAVERVGIHYEMLTFSWAEMAVENTYWYGGDSEETWAQECGEDVSEFDGITKAQFDAAVPPEVRSYRKRPSKKQIKAWCSSADTEVSAVGMVLKRLYSLGAPKGIWTMDKLNGLCEWYESLDHSVWMRWREAEVLNRIADDYFTNAMHGDEQVRPVMGITSIPLDQPDWFRETAKRWSKEAMQLRLADQLLCLLTGKGEIE